jgi:hypothetical protein
LEKNIVLKYTAVLPCDPPFCEVWVIPFLVFFSTLDDERGRKGNIVCKKKDINVGGFDSRMRYE